MREQTRNSLCELILEGEDTALEELVQSAKEKRHTDFWTITSNISHMLDLERKLGCSQGS